MCDPVAQNNARIIDVGEIESAEGVRVLAPHRARFMARSADADTDVENGGGDKPTEKGDGGAKQIKRPTGTIGARRFGELFGRNDVLVARS